MVSRRPKIWSKETIGIRHHDSMVALMKELDSYLDTFTVIYAHEFTINNLTCPNDGSHKTTTTV